MNMLSATVLSKLKASNERLSKQRQQSSSQDKAASHGSVQPKRLESTPSSPKSSPAALQAADDQSKIIKLTPDMGGQTKTGKNIQPEAIEPDDKATTRLNFDAETTSVESPSLNGVNRHPGSPGLATDQQSKTNLKQKFRNLYTDVYKGPAKTPTGNRKYEFQGQSGDFRRALEPGRTPGERLLRRTH